MCIRDRDVLRDVYANLIPQDLRHLMGEYYTCGWLVDFTLDKVGYTGQKELSVLDPTCGSGAFITHAIKRLQQSEKELGNDEIIKIATRNIVGYDINPIAVISAKTNYLLALGDISAYKETISVPVYMCDSILVPTVYAKQKTGKAYNRVKTKAGKFVLPVMQDLSLIHISRAVLLQHLPKGWQGRMLVLFLLTLFFFGLLRFRPSIF